jgi:hypothetical protein
VGEREGDSEVRGHCRKLLGADPLQVGAEKGGRGAGGQDTAHRAAAAAARAMERRRRTHCRELALAACRCFEVGLEDLRFMGARRRRRSWVAVLPGTRPDLA